ncbi:tubulinyl-Tyr carboxypeptidase 2 isoform X6 [Ailuropoda melanoleuca]|uniref:tubulinyl-Tyr carboxypeptidase 2 isoform X6 n=1 Tax=Ailuropoda melanoleuca TaxID=9646 RepID=UPI001494B662|nr:tubulinyl-Tyr carboxypeptidase 2 isoform X6 [Ailuropoda melanoleuca]
MQERMSGDSEGCDFTPSLPVNLTGGSEEKTGLCYTRGQTPACKTLLPPLQDANGHTMTTLDIKHQVLQGLPWGAPGLLFTSGTPWSHHRFSAEKRHHDLRYLTNGQPSIERFPISFKTYFSGNYFHHVVLGIYCNGRYGSLGMSRRAELMDKPLTFRTLSDLIFDFEDSYKKYLHTVKKVKIGLYVPHEPHSFQPIEWKQLVLNVSKMLRADIRKELEKYARDMRMKILKPASAHSPTQLRSRGKSLSPRRRQASPPRRLGRRDKSSQLLPLPQTRAQDTLVPRGVSGGKRLLSFCPWPSPSRLVSRPALPDKKVADLSTLNEVGYQIRI